MWPLLYGLVLVWSGCTSGQSRGGPSWNGSLISPDWVSPEVGVHQGYASDGKDHLLIDSSAIYRRANDPAWTILSENRGVLAGTDFNHFGDGDFQSGQFWVAVEKVINPTTFSQPSIAKIDPATLSILETHSLEGVMPEISGLSISAKEGKLYATSWADGSRIWVFNQSDLTPAGQISLSVAIPKIQGIVVSQDHFYISTEYGLLYFVRRDGRVIGYLKDNTPGDHEGIKVVQGDLWWLVESGPGQSKLLVFRNILSKIAAE